MEQQEKVGRARMIGCALGLAALVAAVVWKLLVR
jgi:hypothetical protein